MPEIIDKREKIKWKVTIDNEDCPYLYYPRNAISCKLLEDSESDYCCEEDCPKAIDNIAPSVDVKMDKLDQQIWVNNPRCFLESE